MPDPTSLNSQTVESAAVIDTLVTGLTPAASFAILDAVMTETLGLAMQNAVARQQSAGLIASAAVSAACARIVATREHREPLIPPSLQPMPPAQGDAP